ncbi:hypothetical protein Tco_0268436 [Tanacetum coccineum]
MKGIKINVIRNKEEEIGEKQMPTVSANSILFSLFSFLFAEMRQFPDISTLANTWISPLPHAQNIDANRSVRRRHIVDRASISDAEHGQPDSACDEAAAASPGRRVEAKAKLEANRNRHLEVLTPVSTDMLGRIFNGFGNRSIRESLIKVNPDDIELGGWNISSMNLADAIAGAMVLDIMRFVSSSICIQKPTV